MRVIYLHQYFNTPEMSFGTRSYEMARRMVSFGHEVHMVTSYREKESKHRGWFQTNEAGIKVHWYPVPYSNEMGFLKRLKAFLGFAFAARKKTIELEGDIIFATSTPLTIAFPAVMAARKNMIPMVFEVRDLWPEMPIAIGALNNPILCHAAHRLEHWAYYNAEAVVALSPGMKEGVVRTGYPAERVAVIPNSSDNTEFEYNAEAAARFRAERNWLGNRPLLVYTGSFGAANDVSYLVPVAKELLRLNSDIRILLVGDGADIQKITSKAEEAGVLGYNLFIEGKLPKREIPALLSAATMASVLFLDLPEMRPNSANKFFDALASGTPVLLNYGGWMHDLVKKHGFGLPMWQQPVAKVAAELDAKLHNPEWLKLAGSKARCMAENYFARDLLANQLINVLHAVVTDKAASAAEIAPGVYR